MFDHADDRGAVEPLNDEAANQPDRVSTGETAVVGVERPLYACRLTRAPKAFASTVSEGRRNNLKRLKKFYLKAKARIRH